LVPFVPAEAGTLVLAAFFSAFLAAFSAPGFPLARE